MSNTHAISLKRSASLLAAITFLTLLTVVNFSAFFGKVGAADLTSRSLALSSTLPGSESGDSVAGSATNGAAATHTFSFTVPNAATSATFTYCTTAIGEGEGTLANGCTAPTGLVLPATPVATDDSDVAFGTAAASGNRITWTATIPQDDVVVNFAGITNPTTIGSFFVRISTSEEDEGTVASAITEGVEITARVAETLGFSTSNAAGLSDPGSTCSPLTTGSAITLGDVDEGALSLTQAYDNYSFFRLYTNASGGVEVQYHGDTLSRASGGEIEEIGAAPVVSDPGNEQFGLAIDTVNGTSNSVAVGSEEDPLDFTYVNTGAQLTNAATGALTPVADYANGAGDINGTPTALFAFVANTPTTIASSSAPNGFVECKTAAVRYIANISPTTTSGTYNTTIVYSAVPTY